MLDVDIHLCLTSDRKAHTNRTDRSTFSRNLASACVSMGFAPTTSCRAAAQQACGYNSFLCQACVKTLLGNLTSAAVVSHWPADHGCTHCWPGCSGLDCM